MAHAIFKCKVVQKIWSLTDHGSEIREARCEDMASMLIEMAKKKRKTDMELIFALCWVVWHSRNLHILRNKMEDPQISVARAEAVVNSYKKIRQPELQSNLGKKAISSQQWKPPPAGHFKVNVDAAVREEQDKEGLGVVIRNSEGKCVAAAMKPSTFSGSVAFAEAEATKLGLEIAESAGCMPLIIETDSQEVVDLVLNRKSTRTEIFWIISEIQERIKRLQQAKIQYESRNCNGVAHSLAKAALEQDSFVSWLDNIPETFLYLSSEFEK